MFCFVKGRKGKSPRKGGNNRYGEIRIGELTDFGSRPKRLAASSC